jgi:hypothetical protein
MFTTDDTNIFKGHHAYLKIPICIQYHEDYPKIYHSKFDHDPLDKG